MRAQAAAHPVTGLCRVLQLSRSGYYAGHQRPESGHARADRALLAEIQKVHRSSRGCYGAVKTWRALQHRGVACGKHRVARLRRQAGLTTARTRRRHIRRQSHHSYPVAANGLNRAFAVPQPNRVWVGGITFIPTRAGYLGCLSTIVADLLPLGSPSCTVVFDEFQKCLREFVRSLHRDVVADAFE